MISFLVSVVKDFAELVSDKYKAMMMKLSLQITGSREDAEEAVQDALLSVHRNQRKITDINSADARNYIYTVTKNAALKIRRQQAKHDSDVTFSDVEGFINIEGQPDIDAFKDEYGFSEEVAGTNGYQPSNAEEAHGKNKDKARRDFKQGEHVNVKRNS